MRFVRRSLIGLFLVSTTLGLLAFAAVLVRDAAQGGGAADGPAREARERVFAVDVVEMVPQTIVPVLSSFGEVQSRVSLEVRAAAAGTVIELGSGVEEGGVVAAGQLLFRIDPTAAERALAVARTDLQDAQAELRDAQRSRVLADDDLASVRAQNDLQQRALARQRDLAHRGVGSAAAVEAAELTAGASDQAVLGRRQAQAEAEARVDQATTRLARARIALNEAARDREETEVRAAFDGVLSDVAVGRGGRVVANERLATLIDPTALEIAFRVSTAQYARLLQDGVLAPADLRVSLRADGYALATTGTIDRESAVVAEGQSGRLLYARLADAAGFRPGDFAEVAVDEPPLTGVVRLPTGAVAAGDSVLVVAEGDRLEAGEVAVLRRQGDTVIVAPGDLVGREVVAERVPQLGAGIAVTVRRGGAGSAAAAEAAQNDAARMLDLSAERRARLVAFVEANDRMPAEAKARVLAQLRAAQVPAATVAQLEGRMGG